MQSKLPGHHLRTFTMSNLDDKTHLGPSYISEGDDPGCLTVHQDLVTISIAERQLQKRQGFTVHLHLWDAMKTLMEKGELASHIRSLAPSRVFIFVAYVGARWKEHQLDDFYAQMEDLLKDQSNVRVYPTHDEFLAVNGKVINVEALDMVAQSDKYHNPQYSWRPRTCACTHPSRKDCGLSRIATHAVEKRVYSHCTEHVEVVPKAVLEKRRRGKLRDKLEPEAKWFHQDYVESLKSFGEYRLFICGDEVKVALISNRLSDEQWVVHQVQDDDFAWFSDDLDERKQKWQELEAFALHIRRSLLAMTDYYHYFESLELGVRLDVGVSDLSRDGVFFVLEITRWWNANYMSELALASPFTQVSRFYGTALAAEIESPSWG